jgi:uncharacterized protein YcbX
MATVSRLFVYPVKSLGGVELAEAEVEARGFRYDRRWMLVDEAGVFLSQRRFPRMALVSVRVGEDSLLLDAPGMPTLEVPFEGSAGGGDLTVNVWGDEVRAAPVGSGTDHWFGRFLGAPCRLVRMPDDAVRPVDPKYALAGDRVGFSDGYPFLLLSQASLDDLNGRLAEPLPVDRFRPNIVVEGCGAFAEDGWGRVEIGDLPFRVAKPCARCAITTVDQKTGSRGKEPLRTLASYRKRGSAVLFGQNLIHDGTGTLRVGDAVEILT